MYKTLNTLPVDFMDRSGDLDNVDQMKLQALMDGTLHDIVTHKLENNEPLEIQS